MTEELNDSKLLREQVDRSREMEQFINSAPGKMFESYLRDQYQNLIIQALEDSPEHSRAAKMIESMMAWIGMTIDQGRVARRILGNIKKQSDDDDWG